jgi:hypothetical protein
MMKRAKRIFLLLAMLAGLAAHAEVAFTTKPAAQATGDKVRITFAVAVPTDVEVAVVDAKGKIVRHLAAGLLGRNAPEPLRKDVLAQELLWDRTDDTGKPAAGGPFQARVSLGLQPVLDRMIGDNPGAILCPQSLAVGPKGELFVIHIFGRVHPEDNSAACTVFDRSGKYLRTILPYPANLTEEKLTGLKRLEVAPGVRAPFLYNAETRDIVAGFGNIVAHQSVATPDGRLVFIGHQEKPKGAQLRYNNPGIKQVTAICVDGSMPAGGPYKTVLATDSMEGGALAIAPDGRTFYAVGFESKGKGASAVYAFTLDEKMPRPMIEKGLKKPCGIAVDKDGNLYVADASGVTVLKPDGTHLGELQVAKADQVAVNPKTGAVYVLDEERRLRKFASWKDAKPVAEVPVPYASAIKEEKALMLAVDATAEPVVVWAGVGGGHFSSGGLGGLWRIEEQANGFAAPVEINKLNDRPSAGPMLDLALDRVNQRLVVDTDVYDLTADKWSKGLSSLNGRQSGMGSFGLDGNFYVQSFYNHTARYTPDLKPLPFAAGKKGAIVHPKGGAGEIHASGVTADPAGNVYLTWNKSGQPEPGDVLHAHSLALHKPDGTLVNANLISAQVRQICSPRVDLQGNIYLGVGARPAGKRMPDGIKGEFGKSWASGTPANELEWYELLYGCIVKFGPEGGALRKGIGGVPLEYSWSGNPEYTLDLKGAKWTYFGASPLVSWRNGAPDVCFCESPRFDVDRFARVFFPDAARFRVGVLDTAGNELCFFGAYGNADSAGPKSAIPAPAIPLFWPYLVEADDGLVYVGDRLNRRVVAVRLAHAAEATTGPF